MDFYLVEEHAVQRLAKEWRTHGRLVIAYDFDNTVFDFHGEGHMYQMVIDLLRESHEAGAFLMVYTARKEQELSFVSDYLKSHNIPFDSINESPDFLPFEQGKKLYYNLLLDDRAGLPSAYRCLKRTLDMMK